MSNNTKTQAKRMGIKSVLAHGTGELAMTTFGRGNSAEVAFQAAEHGRLIPCPYRTERFTVKEIDELIDVEHGDLESILNNPTEIIGEDYLGLKATLEKEFFGREFPQDNAHIQIIHNILDVFKILGLYVSDIVFTIGNLQKVPSDQISGYLTSRSKIESILKEMRPYLGFFGDAFHVPKKNESESNLTITDKWNCDVLRNLGTLRQLTAHGGDKDSQQQRLPLFASRTGIVEYMNISANGNWSMIDDLYQNRIDRINRDFAEHSKTNLSILFVLLNATTEQARAEIVKDYYNFAILKQGKNLGANLTKVREILIDKHYPGVKDKKHDSYRSKVYTIADYLIYRHLRGTKTLDQTVDALRQTSDETEKERCYEELVNGTLKLCGNIVGGQLFDRLTGRYRDLADDKRGVEIKPEWFADVKLDSASTIPFVQILSFLCSFMEGKEINELLTAYIHKFESVQSFIDTLRSLGEEVVFADKYHAFNELDNRFAERTADQLRVLASIGKMKPDLNGAKRILYKTAIITLGAPDDSEYVTDEWIDENILLDPKTPDYETRKTEVNPFRNFVAKNVISSRRFLYLVRYTNSKTVRALMQNPHIVRYVLTRLPESQIAAYSSNTGEAMPHAELNVQIDSLVRNLARFSFESLVENRDGIVKTAKSGKGAFSRIAIERLKALTGLYLTVAYVAIKNLVKVNARYYIAFAIYERDLALIRKMDKEKVEDFYIKFKINGAEKTCPFLALTKYYLAKDEEKDYKPEPGKPFDVAAFREHLKSVKHHFKKKWRDILQKETNEGLAIHETGYLFTATRNNTEHLNVMTMLHKYVNDFHARAKVPMSSYFELYHYVQQRLLLDDSEISHIPQFNRQLIRTCGIPCNDLIKIACVSFGYNLPRYKNLTTEALFDPDSKDGKALQKRIENIRMEKKGQ